MVVTPNKYTAVLEESANFEFVVGEDQFEDLEIIDIGDPNGFRFFKNKKKPFNRYVKRFILLRTVRTKKVSNITLIEKEPGKFEPRLEFQIIDLAKTALDKLDIPVSENEYRLIKARVDLGDCHESLQKLISALTNMPNVDFKAERYAIIPKNQKALLDDALENAGKIETLEAIARKYKLTDQDVILLTQRKRALDIFKRLLEEPGYFSMQQERRKKAGKGSRPENIWQSFFEANQWIFGYGLQLVACESLDNRKLETIVVGADVFDGAGKRIDGLLKTRGAISRSVFSEIKTHTADLLEDYERPGVYSPAKQLRGAVAQVQKTLHKVSLKATENFKDMFDKQDNPTGEHIAFVRPRGVIVIGKLDQFKTEQGINEEKFSSFELYRQGLNGLEIITFDELYERARYITEL